MKKYIKPTWEFVELRPEESLANCGSGGGRKCTPGHGHGHGHGKCANRCCHNK